MTKKIKNEYFGVNQFKIFLKYVKFKTIKIDKKIEIQYYFY